MDVAVTLPSSVIRGGSILMVGDLHLSDKFKGRHRDYLQTSFETMERVEEMVEEIKTSFGRCSAIFFLGDLFGVKEKRFLTHEFRLRVMQFFSRLNVETKDRVFCVQGNHDISHDDMPDFEFLRRLGYFSTPSYVDFLDPVSEDAGVRFHFLHYGHERDEIQVRPGIVNVALGHNDFGFSGIHKPAVPLDELGNLEGVQMLISGHIHNPSRQLESGILPSGNEISLFYPGCPSRVSQRYDDCSAVLFRFVDGRPNYDSIPFNLKPLDEEFLPESEAAPLPSKAELEAEAARVEAWKELTGSLREAGTPERNILDQIKARPDVAPPVKELAVAYLEKEINSSR